MSIFYAIISAGRPMNVPKMTMWMDGQDAMWFVPAAEVGEYRAAGAQAVAVMGRPPMKVRQLNIALNIGFGMYGYEYVVTLDDDLKSLAEVDLETGRRRRAITIPQASRRVVELLEHSDYYLGGCAPTANAMHLKGKRPVVSDRYPAGQLAVHRRHADRPMYDSSFDASEDWDYFLQHVAAHGGVIRLNTIMANFQTDGRNRGGFNAAADREHLYRMNRRKLAAKWPQYVTYPHPKLGEDDIEVRVGGHSAR